ncbi:MAG: hypothetical protein HYT96_04220 [Armatimonadetes bacterium]|nr:hypothetical protein [Armatimonadota bacterium]
MKIPRAIVAVTITAVLLGAAAAYAQSDYYPTPAQADKLSTQLATAIEHSRNSAGSNTMSGAVSHLGHVLNCIEGTRGKNFNAAWGHVCQGQGDGIVADIKGAKNAGNVMLVLESANGLAAAGVKAKDLAAVRFAARGVAGLLQVVADATK